jgi:NitT/TauT family transport system ATP-binding protein
MDAPAPATTMVNSTGRPKVSVIGATKYYATRAGSVHALDNVSMDVQEGEFVCVLGPSGCGKSTLLWSLAGLHALSAGQILLDGSPITGPSAQIGMIFQDANLLPWRNLIRNIQLPAEFKRHPPDHERIRRLIERVGLVGFENTYPRELSGGMQQRASIVRSLSYDPSVLLMDEPFGALDAFTRDEMNLLIQEIWRETGKTVIFITHSITEAVYLSDRIVVLSPRPGRVSRVFKIGFPRPRPIDLQTRPEFIEWVVEVKRSIDHGAPNASVTVE